MRCEEARPLLRAGTGDAEAVAHLEGCAACFAALEAADPIATALVAARPPDVAPPPALAATVLGRWRPRGGLWARLTGPVTTGLAAAAVLTAAAVELLFGVEPAHLASLAPLTVLLVAPAVAVLEVVAAARTALLDTPGLLTAVTAVTLLTGALWLRLAHTGVPTWRSAR